MFFFKDVLNIIDGRDIKIILSNKKWDERISGMIKIFSKLGYWLW